MVQVANLNMMTNAQLDTRMALLSHRPLFDHTLPEKIRLKGIKSSNTKRERTPDFSPPPMSTCSNLSIYEIVQMFQTRSQSILHEQEEHEEQTVKTTIMRKGSAVAAQTFRKQSTSALLIQHNFRQFLTTKSKRVVEKVKQKEKSAGLPSH